MLGLRLARALGRVARVRPHLDDRSRRVRQADRPPVPDAALGAARRRRDRQRHALRDAVERRPVALRRRGRGADLPGRVGAGRAASSERPSSARPIDRPNLITFDVGGTTAKSSLIEGGEVRLTADYHIDRDPRNAGYPVKVPVVDIIEIGMAGGSIAWIDPAGSLKVGPHSAVADPGPACYGRGGTEATLTDANLVTNRIGAAAFMGGRMPLDEGLAEAAIGRLGEQLGNGRRRTRRAASSASRTRAWSICSGSSLSAGVATRESSRSSHAAAAGRSTARSSPRSSRCRRSSSRRRLATSRRSGC